MKIALPPPATSSMTTIGFEMLRPIASVWMPCGSAAGESFLRQDSMSPEAAVTALGRNRGGGPNIVISIAPAGGSVALTIVESTCPGLSDALGDADGATIADPVVIVAVSMSSVVAVAVAARPVEVAPDALEEVVAPAEQATRIVAIAITNSEGTTDALPEGAVRSIGSLVATTRHIDVSVSPSRGGGRSTATRTDRSRREGRPQRRAASCPRSTAR